MSTSLDMNVPASQRSAQRVRHLVGKKELLMICPDASSHLDRLAMSPPPDRQPSSLERPDAETMQ